jgi:Ser/Thr protein kinase RdoA (MazF antagonist)
MVMLEDVLSAYGLSTASKVQQHGSGLIHNTWKVIDHSNEYILQRVNDHVFKRPEFIAGNIEAIASWLAKNHPGYFFVTPVRTNDNKPILFIPDQGYFRLFPFVKDSYTCEISQSPQQAYEAAKQFGLFTRVLRDFPIEKLQITLPGFHDLSNRHAQFEHSVKHGNVSRIKEGKNEIDYLRSQNHIVSTYQQVVSSKEFKMRVTHHDTKISNVLFDQRGKGICVIDLDTVMPGHFISDVGDMMRTYLSPVSEEEKDFEKIEIRDEYFKAIAQGYLTEMGNELSSAELNHFVYSGLFLVYMQALRFLTDYFNNDIYYGASYEGHNYVRAKNQVVLLQRLLQKKNKLDEIVSSVTSRRD